MGTRRWALARAPTAIVLPLDAVDLDAIACARLRHRLDVVRACGRRGVEAVAVAEDGPALVLRLVRTVAGAERGPGETAEQRTLAGAAATLHHRTARCAQPGAEQRADRARLGDAHGAITAGGAIGGGRGGGNQRHAGRRSGARDGWSDSRRSGRRAGRVNGGGANRRGRRDGHDRRGLRGLRLGLGRGSQHPRRGEAGAQSGNTREGDAYRCELPVVPLHGCLLRQRMRRALRGHYSAIGGCSTTLPGWTVIPPTPYPYRDVREAPMTAQLDNLMMNYPLTLPHFIERTRLIFAKKMLASRVPGLGLERVDYARW